MGRVRPLAVARDGDLDALFPGLGRYLARRFGVRPETVDVAPLSSPGTIKGGGYGTPHVLTLRRPGAPPERIVLETVRPGGFGHEDRADRAAIVVRAADDAGGLPDGVPVVGYGALRRGGAAPLEDTSEFFVLTPWIEGTPYADDLEAIAARDALLPIDHERVRALADWLSDLHREPAPHPTWYRRRLRDLAGSGECVAGVADSYPEPCGFVTSALLARVESLVLWWRYRLRGRSERLRRVHGDFHPWNVLFQEGPRFRVLDRSRGALGEPADDVAALVVNHLFFALRTRGAFDGPFADLFAAFWRRYLERSGDAALSGVIAPFFAFRALVLANPLWYPNESDGTRRKLFRFLLGALENERFVLEDVPHWVDRADP